MTTLARPPLTAREMLNKVPEVTLYFWIIKVLCTTVGETAADYLATNVGLGLTNDDVHHCQPCCSPRSWRNSAFAATSRRSTGLASC